MANSVRKNTVKLVFGLGVKVPSHLDVFKFCIDNLKLSVADIHSIYKDENGGQFYVKIVDEPTFEAFISEKGDGYSFKFEDGSAANVHVESASQIFRYVRIFNLPPEVDDSAIQYVLGKYGTIRQHVRERFPSEMKIDIFTGVRGVHMEVPQEIPAHLYVEHFRARIYYDGLKNKCFFCKAEGHFKSACPKLAVPGGSGSGSGADSGIGSGKGISSGLVSDGNSCLASVSLGRPSKPIIDRSIPKSLEMTNLNILNAKRDDTTITASKSAGSPESPATSSPGTSKAESVARSATEANPRRAEVINDLPALPSDLDNDDYMDDEVSEIDRVEKLKRTKNEERSKNSDSSESDPFQQLERDEQRAPPFTSVTKNRRSNSKKNKR